MLHFVPKDAHAIVSYLPQTLGVSLLSLIYVREKQRASLPTPKNITHASLHLSHETIDARRSHEWRYTRASGIFSAKPNDSCTSKRTCSFSHKSNNNPNNFPLLSLSVFFSFVLQASVLSYRRDFSNCPGHLNVSLNVCITEWTESGRRGQTGRQRGGSGECIWDLNVEEEKDKEEKKEDEDEEEGGE